MKVLYFAMLRERLNRSEQEVAPPPHVVTIADFIQWLRSEDEAIDLALGSLKGFNIARDATIVDRSAPLSDAGVIAILPPMTGG